MSAIFEVLLPPMGLARKTGTGRRIDPAAIARAEADLGRMGDEYLQAAAGDLAMLKGLVTAANAAVTSAQPLAELFGRIRAVVHDMRGIGGSVGFALVGQIADSLHRLLSLRPTDAPLPAVAAHIDALRAAIAGRVMGDGGTVGCELLAELEELSAQ